MSKPAKIALYIEPSSHHFFNDKLFIVEDGRLNGDRINAPFAHLRDSLSAQGITVHTADFLPEKANGVKNIYVSMGMLHRYQELAQRNDVVLSAYFAMECPIVDPALFRALPEAGQYFKRLMTWSDGESLAPFVGSVLPFHSFRWAQSFDRVHENAWNRTDRKFMVMINANKLPALYRNELYTERLRAVEFFSRTNEIDLYGIGWNEPSHHLGKSFLPYTVRRMQKYMVKQWQKIRPDPRLTAARKVYLGTAQSKAETLSQYTFALCFENMILKGWITEKIFDCFFAGTIPIYWGAPEITDYVPENCFIDKRKFQTYEELRSFLKSLSEKEITAYRENARDFIASKKFAPFSKQAFTDLFKKIVAEDGEINL
ncbi:MAG: glycosyltransferase family 10 [Actinomycetota bacterium]